VTRATRTTRSRRSDRKRRVACWAACAAAGAAAGLLLLGAGLGVLAAAAAPCAGLLVGHLFMLAPRGVPVLTYHSVSPDAAWLPWGDEISVRPETLRLHLETMRRMGCTIIGTRRLVEARLRGERLPRRPVVLHFDDGYLDNWLFALPLLREAQAPATFFASLDFVAPGGAPRPRGTKDHRGYMNWAELAAIEADPLFEVEPHGIDHGRVPVSTRAVDRLTAANWRRLAWVQWAATRGPKHDWYLAETPPAVPLGSPVRESEGALAAAALGESEETYRARVTDHLGRCITAFRERLGIDPAIFCWPENRVSPAAREIAARLGYAATTGGDARNTVAEPGEILSRIHVSDLALGFPCAWAERLRLRATVGLFEGNHYWYLVAAPMDLTRRLAFRLRRRLAARHLDVPRRDIRNASAPPSVTV
jgi:hypothetical protein